MQRVKVDLIDDLDQESIAAKTVKFSVDDTRYEIDVNEAHLAEFHEALAPFVGSARRVGGPRSNNKAKPAATRNRDELAAIRAWGQANGYAVSDKGRVPAAVQEAYKAAQAKSKRRARAKR